MLQQRKMPVWESRTLWGVITGFPIVRDVIWALLKCDRALKGFLHVFFCFLTFVIVWEGFNIFISWLWNNLHFYMATEEYFSTWKSLNINLWKDLSNGTIRRSQWEFFCSECWIQAIGKKIAECPWARCGLGCTGLTPLEFSVITWGEIAWHDQKPAHWD